MGNDTELNKNINELAVQVATLTVNITHLTETLNKCVVDTDSRIREMQLQITNSKIELTKLKYFAVGSATIISSLFALGLKLL